MKIQTLLLLVSPLLFTPAAAIDMTPVEQMALIEGPAWGERQATLKRFKFLLGRFDELCVETEGRAPVHDMLVYVHTQIEEAGLMEGSATILRGFCVRSGSA